MKREELFTPLLVACVLVAGCAAPFGVRHASPEAVHRTLTSNVLSTGDLSNSSQIILRRENLTELFDDDPEAALRTLRRRMQAGALVNDDLFTLAELSFHHAERRGGKPHFFAAAIYAYAYLFPDDALLRPDPFDPRLREAVDIYNRSLTEAFESADREYVEIAGGTYVLPFGQVEVAFDEQQLQWATGVCTNSRPRLTSRCSAFAIAIAKRESAHRWRRRPRRSKWRKRRAHSRSVRT